MDQGRGNYKTATGSAIAPESHPADISSDSESVRSSPPIRTKAIAQCAHSNSWAIEYPPRNLKYAVEHIRIFPSDDENVDKENLKYIISKSNDSEPSATPRPLPMTPVVHAKGNSYGPRKTQAGQAFDGLLGNMMGLVHLEGVALEPENDGAAANLASAKSQAVLSSLSYLSPRLAEDRGIRSKETDQREYNWVDEAATKMDGFLAGGDELIVNNYSIIDLDEVVARKPKKKKKNKMSSKKRKQIRASKTSLEGSSTAAEDKHEHDASQNTINETAEHTSTTGASTLAEHDISRSTTDKKAKKAASESDSTPVKHEHQHDTSQYTADKMSKQTSMKGASTSEEQDTPKNTTDVMSEIYTEERSEDEKHSKKTPSEGAPTPREQDFDENTADELSELHGNDNPEDVTISAEDDTLQHIPEHTTNEISKMHTNERLSDEQNGVTDAMTDNATRMVTTSKKGKEKMNAPTRPMATLDGFTEQEIMNIIKLMNFFNSKIELYERLFAEMKGLTQSLVTEFRLPPDLQSKYSEVVEDLCTTFTKLHDVDTGTHMKAHNIKNTQAGGAGANVNKNDFSSADTEETSLEILCGMKNNIQHLVDGGGGATELQKAASRVGHCQGELDEFVKRLDADIKKYAEISNQLQGSIKIVKNDIVGLKRSSKANKSEFAKVVNTATGFDENVRAIHDTLHQIVDVAHNVPTFQQASANYDRAMYEIENDSSKCNQLKKIVDYNSEAVKKGKDGILGSLDKHAKVLNKHGERLNKCHEIVTKTHDAVRGHRDHLNSLNNKANAHQKLIAKVTAQSDSNARRLHYLSDTTARDIQALSESTSRDIEYLTKSTSRHIKETFDQLKETQVQLGTLKAKVDCQNGAIAGGNSLDEQKIKDIVMTLLTPIAPMDDKLHAKVEACWGPLDHISPMSDGLPQPRKLSFAQNNPHQKAPASGRAAVEAQQTASQPTGVAHDATHTDIPGLALEPEIKVPKVCMPQIDRVRSRSVSETPGAASPAPISPHPLPPGHGSVSGQSPPAMQILKRPEQRRSSLARLERHPQDDLFPDRVVAERRNSMQRHDSIGVGNGLAGPGMVIPMVMDRVMMAPQNGYGEGYGDMVVAQQHQVAYIEQQMVVTPPGPGSQQVGLLPQMFGDEYGQQQFGQQQYDQQYDQQHSQQHHDQFGQEVHYPIGHPRAIIPVDENIPPALYLPQEDPRDNHIMLLTYNVDNLNARVNEATNAMSVTQSSIRNFRTQYRYEIGQEVEREVERAMGRELVRMEARINQILDMRMNNT